jgi:hypothetical protein
MSDHIPTRELSALLDRDPEEEGASRHLEECPACQRELELLRRMRMALSAMDEPEPPAGQWDRIQGRLSERGVVRSGGTAGGGDSADGGAARPRSAAEGPGDRPAVGSTDAPVREGTGTGMAGGVPGWLRVAAGVVLFAGGVGLGVTMNRSSPGPDTGPQVAAEAPAADDGAVSPAAEGGPTRRAAGTADPVAAASGAAGYRSALRQLEALRAEGLSPEEAFRNPDAAAEQLARLDALIRASREALADDPADPAVNDFLFQVVEERQALNQALHLSSLEYR